MLSEEIKYQKFESNLCNDDELTNLIINLSFLNTDKDATPNSPKIYQNKYFNINKNANLDECQKAFTPSKYFINSSEENNISIITTNVESTQEKNHKNEFKNDNTYLNKLKLDKRMPGYHHVLYRLLEGKFALLIRNYSDSKHLQKALQFWNPDIIIKIFWEIYPQIPNLIVDPYGNYFCQKLYRHLPIPERLHFLLIIQPFFMAIASNNYGNYTLQFIIENFKSEEELALFKAPLTNVNSLDCIIKNFVGIHVVEKLIKSVPENKIEFIYQYAIRNYVNLASNKIFINLIKKIILYGNEIYMKSIIIKLTLKNFDILINHPIANNSIQCILEVNNNFLII
jgi:pumilio RNA-binding family